MDIIVLYNKVWKTCRFTVAEDGLGSIYSGRRCKFEGNEVVYIESIYIYIPTVSAFYINVIRILINQGDIFLQFTSK